MQAIALISHIFFKERMPLCRNVCSKSEAVMICSDESLDLFEGLEVLENTILKDGVEFVFDTC